MQFFAENQITLKSKVSRSIFKENIQEWKPQTFEKCMKYEVTIFIANKVHNGVVIHCYKVLKKDI